MGHGLVGLSVRPVAQDALTTQRSQDALTTQRFATLLGELRLQGFVAVPVALGGLDGISGVRRTRWRRPDRRDGLRLARSLAGLTKRLGGTLPGDMGCFAHIVDTEGNRVGLHARV